MDKATTYIIYLININITNMRKKGAEDCHLIINHDPMNFSSWPIFACRIGVLSVYQVTGPACEIRGESFFPLQTSTKNKQTHVRNFEFRFTTILLLFFTIITQTCQSFFLAKRSSHHEFQTQPQLTG